MLPELDVFHANSHQLVHPEWVTLHHKDLVFVTPAGQMIKDQSAVSVVDYCLLSSDNKAVRCVKVSEAVRCVRLSGM